MADDQRRGLATRRATEMAKSGHYRDSAEILASLRLEGFPEAAQWLDARAQDSLNKLCREHFGRR